MFRIITDGENFREYVLLKDGQGVLLRTAKPEDVPAVDAFMQGVSQESLQMRFMGGVAQVSRDFIGKLCDFDPKEQACLLAIIGEGPDMKVVGMGNYMGIGGRNTAEVAFLVADNYQGRGISTLILERLAGIASGNGFVGFEAEVLFDNQPMINVFKDSGFEGRQAVDGGSIHVEFPVSGAAALRERADLRDRIAAANSLVPLLRPKTVAVVGASREPSSIGSLIFRYILGGRFRGTVYPVNNQAVSVNGVRAYPSLDKLPEPADLVVVAVPADQVLDVAEDAIHAGAKGLIVVTSGFAESGKKGMALQNKLVNLVRSHGARLVGPNCLGILNTDPEVELNASLAAVMPPSGRVGFYSHSAALGLVILDYAAERGIGFSSFVSAGNRADVSGNDLLQYWEEDPNTDLALLYLETFGNPRRFARIARRFSCRKPVLCVKGARSRAGRDAARAHIAAGIQSDVDVDVLFRQAGVIRADTLEEMFDVAALLEHQPLPRGNRVAIISNSGGVVTICADACEANGLVLDGPGIVDLGPLADAEAYEKAVREALSDDKVDSLITIFACVGDCDPKPVGRAIRRGVLRAEKLSGVAKPVLLCLMGAAGLVQVVQENGIKPGSKRHVFPSYRFPESAARALARVVHYGEYRHRPPGRVTWYEDVDPALARREVKGVLENVKDRDEIVWVDGDKAWIILGCFGIRTDTKVVPEAGEENGGISFEVRADPHFGPLIHLHPAGKDSLDRITPLTDQDVAAFVEHAEAGDNWGVGELLGRMSQLLEELPWLCAMKAEIRRAGSGPFKGKAVLNSAVSIGFKASGFSGGKSTSP
ncbi:MAG: GNAT family N-acetyltransferase [Acidobacteriota bacterium]